MAVIAAGPGGDTVTVPTLRIYLSLCQCRVGMYVLYLPIYLLYCTYSTFLYVCNIKAELFWLSGSCVFGVFGVVACYLPRFEAWLVACGL